VLILKKRLFSVVYLKKTFYEFIIFDLIILRAGLWLGHRALKRDHSDWSMKISRDREWLA